MFYIIRLAAFVWIIELLSACASAPINRPKTPPILEQKSDRIQLLEHQQKPIRYMLDHPDVKGLLVAHQMGTGKTLLAIGLSEELLKRKAIQNTVVIATQPIFATWLLQMKQFGVANSANYELVSYANAVEHLGKRDLTNTLLILDEAHNLIRYLRSPNLKEAQDYGQLYFHLQTAERTLALTGTPIYNDEYDLAYLFNLVSAKNLLPFNQEEFRVRYTKVDRLRSLWRGYLTESWTFQFALTFFGTVVGTILMPPLGALLGPVVGLGAFPILNHAVAPLDRYALRFVDVEMFRPIVSRYLSFHAIEDQDWSDYPSKTIHFEKLNYSRSQLDFFLRYMENNLSDSELLLLLTEQGANYNSNYIRLNSTLLHQQLHQAFGDGREIGNLVLKDAQGKKQFPSKFEQILSTMKQNGMPQTVVYSNYMQNGVLAFAEFLDQNGLQNKYAILTPDLSTEAFSRITESYNQGHTSILLLHPEITEGISLKKTRQFHILEPIINKAMFDQVVARAVRYKSHSELPANQRHVNVYVYIQNGGDLWNDFELKKENWRLRASQANHWSVSAQLQLDPNYSKKRQTPDQLVQERFNQLNTNTNHFFEIAKQYSVENQ